MLSHPENKKTLTVIFGQIFITEFSSLQYVVAYGVDIKSNIPGWRIHQHNHFEADTLLLCVANELLTLEKASSFKVVSPDTDVLILSVYFFVTSMFPFDMIFELTTNRGSRIMSVNRIAEGLGKEKSNALLGFYVMTGCDQIGSFNGITKKRSFKTFMELPRYLELMRNCLK